MSKEEKQMLKAVRDYGVAELKPIRNGFLVLGPRGTSVLHPGGSSSRLSISLKQIEANLRRIGALPPKTKTTSRS